MAIQVATLRVLMEKALLDPGVAQAVAEAIELETTKAISDLPTRQDLHATKQDLHHAIENLRAATRHDIEELRAATRHDIEELRVATHHDIEELRVATRHDIEQLERKVDVKLEALKAELTRSMYVAIFTAMTAQTGLVTGIMYFLLRSAH